MGAIIGIDLGTTFSALAYIDEIGRSVILIDSEGNNITPSCVAERDGTLRCGDPARRMAREGQGAEKFKLDMGTSIAREVGSHSLTPTELSSIVLRKLADHARSKLGEISECVVTIPANFSHEAREATMLAAQGAGLDVRNIINEPTAAALYYASQEGQSLHGHYAVFDLGGGTFDVSIINIEGEDVTVISSSGVAKLGGNDFDDAIIRLVSKIYKNQVSEEMHPDDFELSSAEELKKQLSWNLSQDARIGRKRIEITRSEFEEEISTLLAQIEMHCEAALEEAGLAPNHLNGVLLAGGSTRIPAVKAAAQRVFGMAPIESANVDEVVALGAALYAARKANPEKLNAAQRQSINRLQIQDVTNDYFGVIAVSRQPDGTNERLENSIIIRKGEKIPCSVTKDYYTIADNQQAVQIRVTRSKAPETDPQFVSVIREFQLPLPPGRPGGQRIDVTFSYDDNQIMHCKFVDVESGKTIERPVTLKIDNTMNQSEVDKFTVE